MSGDGDKKRSALNLSDGINPPGSINREALDRLKKGKKDHPDTGALKEGILNGEVALLGRAITLVESNLHEHQELARELITSLLPHSGNSFRIGITGMPGAGKSTFIDALGKHILDRGGTLAVLAVDPSSERSGGSILGDKTRMEELAGHSRVFIRPSPSGGSLGGVARKTRETIILCEAAGFDHVIVETVGVGQSETVAHSMVDFFLLIMIPGAGDELQGIKRGIMEMADAVVINKADGNNIQKALRTKTEFSNALHLFPLPPSGWNPPVKTCSSIQGMGITEIWEMALEFKALTRKNGFFASNRKEQSIFWMYQTLKEGIYSQLYGSPGLKMELERFEKEIEEGKITPFDAAASILSKYASPEKE